MKDHGEFRDWAASYVLGSLAPGERSEFETHLASCGDCRLQIAEFAPIPGLLSRVEPVKNSPAPDLIAERAIQQVRSDWATLQRSRARWRLAAAAAVVVVVGLVAVLVSALPASHPGRTLHVESDATTNGEIILISKAWGTEVEIQVEGLPADDQFVAWVVSTDGSWEQVAVWGPTPLNGARVTGASSVATNDVQSVVITAGDDHRLVATAEPTDT